MRFESQTRTHDDHIGRITDCSTRYGQAPAACTRVRLAKERCYGCACQIFTTLFDHHFAALSKPKDSNWLL